MKKQIVSCVIGLLCGAVFASEGSRDSYLYWMIDTADLGSKLGEQIVQTGQTGLVAVGADGGETRYLNLYGQASSSSSFNDGKAVGISRYALGDLGVLAAIGTFGDNTSFFVEILNGSDVIGKSDIVPYVALSDYISSMRSGAIPANPYAFSGFVAAPEPNSALLLLIGCAALALRRRKQIKV